MVQNYKYVYRHPHTPPARLHRFIGYGLQSSAVPPANYKKHKVKRLAAYDSKGCTHTNARCQDFDLRSQESLAQIAQSTKDLTSRDAAIQKEMKQRTASRDKARLVRFFENGLA